MSADPVEEYVSQAIHEVFMEKQGGFIAVVQLLLGRGQTREAILNWVRSAGASRGLTPEMYRMMETEVDYLIAEAKNG